MMETVFPGVERERADPRCPVARAHLQGPMAPATTRAPETKESMPPEVAEETASDEEAG